MTKMEKWFSHKIKELATLVNVRAWIFIYRDLFKSHHNKLKVLDVCAGEGKFVEGLIKEGIVDQGLSMDRKLPSSFLNHEFIECDITLPVAMPLNFKPDLISINNSIQLFPDSKPLMNLVKLYSPMYVLITKPTERVIDLLSANGYQHNTRMVPVEELLSELGYFLKQKRSMLKVHYKLSAAKYIFATLLTALTSSRIVDKYLSKGEYYEYYLFEKR